MSKLLLVPIFSILCISGCFSRDNDNSGNERAYAEAGGVQPEGSYTPPAKSVDRATSAIEDISSLSYEFTDSGVLVSGYVLPSEQRAVQAIFQSSEIQVRGECDSPEQSDLSCMIRLTSHFVGLFQSDPRLSGAAVSRIEELMPQLDAEKIASSYNLKYGISKIFVVTEPDKTRSDITVKRDDNSGMSEVRFKMHYQDTEQSDRIFSVTYQRNTDAESWVLRKIGSVPSLSSMATMMNNNQPDLINDMTVSVPLDPVDGGRVIVIDGEPLFIK